MRDHCFGCKETKDKIGILLAQLGTPEAPTPKALRKYLAQFLADPRVVEKNRILWWLILHGIILRVRPARSAALYARIWDDEGSPLLKTTENQAKKLQESLRERSDAVEVAYGMRYGSPSLETAVDNLIERGCTKILLLPMYPQYSAATTASTFDVVFPHLLKRRFVPTLRVAEPYYAHPEYIGALASTINEFLETCPAKPELLLLSYHGVPEQYVEKGDPYCCHCTETTEALRGRLIINSKQVKQTYQSRFGREPWLVPYTDITIETLAGAGVKNIAVACPGFTADCLETLDEMGNEARHLFIEQGGEQLLLIPCLNDQPAWISALAKIVEEEISSWLDTANQQRNRPDKINCPVAQEKLRQDSA